LENGKASSRPRQKGLDTKSSRCLLEKYDVSVREKSRSGPRDKAKAQGSAKKVRRSSLGKKGTLGKKGFQSVLKKRGSIFGRRKISGSRLGEESSICTKAWENGKASSRLRQKGLDKKSSRRRLEKE
jgi:hypothetical protein